MSHVFLIGFMGAGKSTVAALVAEQLGMPLCDLDSLVERRANRSVAEIFATEGEAGFRRLESEALASLEDEPPGVIACGGGVVLADANRSAMHRLGRVVLLEVSAGEALARIGDDDTRPLLAGAGGALAATALLAARESLYRAAADIAIDTSGRTAAEVASEVVAWLEDQERS